MTTTQHEKMKLQIQTEIGTWKHYLVVDGVMDDTFSDTDRDAIQKAGQLLVDAGLAYWF